MGFFKDVIDTTKSGLETGGGLLGEGFETVKDVATGGVDVGKDIVTSEQVASATSGLGDVFKANTPSALLGQTGKTLGSLFEQTGLGGITKGLGGLLGGKSFIFIAVAVVAVVILIMVMK